MKSSVFSDYFHRVSEGLSLVNTESVVRLVDLLLEARDKGCNIYIFGNGGSGATASHITGDFLKGISYGLNRRFRVQCLNDNVSALMAISNDLSYEEIFVEQLKAFLQPEDVVIGISGSGNSANVVKALSYARDQKAHTVAFCGFRGGKIREIADLCVHVPIHDMEITEDIHVIIFHAIKQAIMKELKGDQCSMGDTYDARVKD
jgi:D-sedoheptulose 7-phosphate isomerase